MRRHFRLQFGLRSLLVAALLLPPLIAVQYRRWCDDRIWVALQDAKNRRDAALVAWRVVYASTRNSATGDAQEQAARQRFFSAREDVEAAVQALHSRYGNSEDEVVREMQALYGK